MAGQRVSPPHIVFFGPPQGGKSTLIRTFLAQAQETPIVSLQSVYEPGDRLIRHELHLPTGEHFVLIDTQGQAAQHLIGETRVRQFRVFSRSREELASAVYTTDTLVLPIDASADDLTLNQLFGSFSDFLDSLEDSRTINREVGGLPIYLTLTKCDALAQPEDTFEQWLSRIDARKQVVRQRFEDYLADTSQRIMAHGFGSISIAIHATAMQIPNRPGAQAHKGPFGIVELVQCTTQAATRFARRREQARRRLRWTLTGTGSLVGGMMMILAVLVTSGGPQVDPLVRHVRDFRANWGPPETRMAPKAFPANYAELQSIQLDKGFTRLPDDLQSFVTTSLEEFEDYKQYRKRFLPPQLGPSDVRSQSELTELQTALDGPLQPPKEYAEAWARTEAVQLHQKWQSDLKQLQGAEEQLYNWYRGLIRRATALELTTSLDPVWFRDVDQVLADATAPPFQPSGIVPGSKSLSGREGRPLTYAPIFDFDRVVIALSDWEVERSRLVAIQSLAYALGFGDASGAVPAILVLPFPGEDLQASRELGAQRLRLFQTLTHDRNIPPELWNCEQFPDPLRSIFRDRLEQQIDIGLRHVQRLLSRDHPNEITSVEARQTLVGSLRKDNSIQDWGEFLEILHQLSHAQKLNPVEELMTFLQQARFPVRVRVLEIQIPDDLRGQRVIPAESLTLTLDSPEQPEQQLTVFREGEPLRRGFLAITRYAMDPAKQSFELQPSDRVMATLRCRAGTQEFDLIWKSSREGSYRFDLPNTRPEIQHIDSNLPNERAPGVRLLIQPEDGWPRLPALLR